MKKLYLDPGSNSPTSMRQCVYHPHPLWLDIYHIVINLYKFILNLYGDCAWVDAVIQVRVFRRLNPVGRHHTLDDRVNRSQVDSSKSEMGSDKPGSHK